MRIRRREGDDSVKELDDKIRDAAMALTRAVRSGKNHQLERAALAKLLAEHWQKETTDAGT